MKLEDIKNCHVCGSINLIPRLNIPIAEFFVEEDTLRDVLFCDDCETIHYLSEGILNYEFSCTLDKEIGRKVKK